MRPSKLYQELTIQMMPEMPLKTNQFPITFMIPPNPVVIFPFVENIVHSLIHHSHILSVPNPAITKILCSHARICSGSWSARSTQPSCCGRQTNFALTMRAGLERTLFILVQDTIKYVSGLDARGVQAARIHCRRG